MSSAVFLFFLSASPDPFMMRRMQVIFHKKHICRGRFPSSEVFADAVGAMGISENDEIVVYDQQVRNR